VIDGHRGGTEQTENDDNQGQQDDDDASLAGRGDSGVSMWVTDTDVAVNGNSDYDQR